MLPDPLHTGAYRLEIMSENFWSSKNFGPRQKFSHKFWVGTKMIFKIQSYVLGPIF